MASEIEEIEAILNEKLHLLPDEQDGRYPILVGVKEAARAIAAHRSKDREDGEREMRERARAACLENSEQIDPRCDFDSGFGAGLGQAAVIVAALPLTTRTEGGSDA